MIGQGSQGRKIRNLKPRGPVRTPETFGFFRVRTWSLGEACCLSFCYIHIEAVKRFTHMVNIKSKLSYPRSAYAMARVDVIETITLLDGSILDHIIAI